ncbi:mitochondrial splicing system protein [Blastocladiella emersonii ATCC 22665]|nr:mitochondrial splicing system protein [Blastocladiella emersonii ATCC 22665]
MTVAALRHPETRTLLDRAMVVAFQAPKSFTGEDTVEIHAHGGPAVVKGLLGALAAIPGAFMNGKLDLTEVEGLKDLVQAETEAQRQLALRQADGELGRLYEDWRKRIVQSMGHIEAMIDFGEDEQFEDGIWDTTRSRILALRGEIESHLNDGRRGEVIRNGIRVTLFGPVNAGKSSMLNYLARRHVAIVSEEPGTTRDIIETTIDVAGFPVILSDTAGMRAGAGKVEAVGIQLARQRLASDTDLRIALVDLERDVPRQLADLGALVTSDTMVVLNKVDRVSRDDGDATVVDQAVAHCRALTPHVAVTSIAAGDGMDEFVRVLGQLLNSLYGVVVDSGAGPVLTNERQRNHLQSCVQALDRFLAHEDDVVMAAEELRLAALCIGRIGGLVDTEQVLDVIFRDFCIGK